MKMYKKLITMLALAVSLVSCQKAAEMNESAEVSEGRLEVTGRVADGKTKTVFTCEGHVLAPEWKVGDKIIGLWGEDKTVTWSVRKVVDGVAKFKYVSGEEPGDGEAVNVMYAPGKSASDISGTGDARTLAYDLSSQPGTLEGLGKVSLMTGYGTVSGESLELTFTHTLAVVSLDTLKGLIPNGSGYSISIEGDSLANCGTFGISGGAIAFTKGADGRISTGSTFTANADGEIGPAFFAVPAANLGELMVSASKGADTVRFKLSGSEVTAGNYYYKASMSPGRVIGLSLIPVPDVTLPGFEAGKSVRVSNGTESEDCIVRISGGSARINATLDGNLTAVYPSDAADMSGEQITGVKVAATQSGKFKDAVIAGAEIGSEATEAAFSYEAAVLRFYVEKGVGVKKITVTGQGIADGGNTITVDGGIGTLDGVTDDPGRRLCYVAVPKGFNAGSLTFVGETGTQGSVSGLALSETGALSAGNIYDAFIPYYLDLGDAGKWAYCNVGAFLPEERGSYFAWGTATGYGWTGAAFDGSHSFDQGAAPHYDGSAYNKYTGKDGDGKTVLESGDDAATGWGSAWCMPRADGFLALNEKSGGQAVSDYEGSGVSGMKFTSSADATKSVFLPACGYGSGTSLAESGTKGYYWSGTLHTTTTNAYGLTFGSSIAPQGGLGRFYGLSVRPVYRTSVTGVSLNKTAVTMVRGKDTTLVATVTPYAATDKDVTWSSDNTGVATVDDTGKVTAVEQGTAHITVTTTDGGKTATCTVEVGVPVESVSLSPTTATIDKGNTQTLTASVLPDDATNKNVTWSSSDNSVATVDNTGKVTAVAKGTATITVTTEDGGKTATCAVTVNVPVESVSLNTTSATINKNGTQTLTATVLPEDATNRNVTWSSSNTGVATVDANGKVTAKAKGTATITVTTEDGGKQATCNVTVNVPVTGVSLSETSIAIAEYGGYNLSANVTPSDASNRNVTWSSSNTGVATVDNTGKVTAVAKGTATITVTTEDGRKTATCNVTVYVPVAGVTLSKTTGSLRWTTSSKELTLAVTVTPADADNKGVTWAVIENSEYVKIENAGDLGCTVRLTTKPPPLDPVSCKVQVTTKDGGHTAKCTITCKY